MPLASFIQTRKRAANGKPVFYPPNYMYTLVNESRPFYVETEMLASTLFLYDKGGISA